MAKSSKLAHDALAALMVIAFAISPATAQISATGTVTAVPSRSDNYLFFYPACKTPALLTSTRSGFPGSRITMTSFHPCPRPLRRRTIGRAMWRSGYYGSIQYYDTANSPITHGQTNSSFQFLSPDAPRMRAPGQQLLLRPAHDLLVCLRRPAIRAWRGSGCGGGGDLQLYAGRPFHCARAERVCSGNHRSAAMCLFFMATREVIDAGGDTSRDPIPSMPCSPMPASVIHVIHPRSAVECFPGDDLMRYV